MTLCVDESQHLGQIVVQLTSQAVAFFGGCQFLYLGGIGLQLAVRFL